MTLTADARTRTCERQVRRLGAPDLQRHELLDVATTLSLLYSSIDLDSNGEVEGHELGGSLRASEVTLAGVRGQLEWLGEYGHAASVSELQGRTRFAAEELLAYLAWGIESGTPTQET